MLYKLSSKSKNIVLNLGETGMGYTLIKVDEVEEYIIINYEYAIRLDEHFLIGYELPFEMTTSDKLDLVSKVVVLIPNPASPSAKPSGVYVPPPFIYYTAPGDVFYRLSAFAADHCILNSPVSLRNKSYAITKNDKHEVPSGLAAVARYALPTRFPTTHVWKLIPPAKTQVLVGTVIPNFGMSGGGVEVYFPNGFTGGTIVKVADLPVM